MANLKTLDLSFVQITDDGCAAHLRFRFRTGTIGYRPRRARVAARAARPMALSALSGDEQYIIFRR